MVNLFKVYGNDVSRKQWLREYPLDRIVYDKSDRLVSIISDIVSEIKASSLDFFDFESHLDGGVTNIQKTDWIQNAQVAKWV